MLVHDLADPGAVRIVGHALEQQGDGTVGQGAVQDVAVAGYPAEVSGAPVDVTVVVVKHILVGHGGVHHVTPGGVQHALGRTGGAGGVEHEQRVFRVHRLRIALRRRGLHQVLITEVTTFGPGHRLIAGAGHHDDRLDVGRFLVTQSGVHVFLERNGSATTQPFISSDHIA